ncbi:hypothetical protein [Kitasatospora phosalacinea]|uniref:hypothetical protein n=1 Tax=Kitasatospora phosalacinea TaxID=2065 RepID=UPI0005278966|nr:hypothetical protein [Kitasatospora phosalacinea]
MSLRIAIPPDDLRRRCETASVRAVADHPDYEDGAVVPAGPWHPLTETLYRKLTPTTGTADATLVELVYAADIDPRLLAAPHVTALGRTVSPPDAATTTTNHTDGRRIGIHLDNWDKLDYQHKADGRRRLCLNLGPGTRYLLVCDTDIQEICRTVRPDYATCYPHTDDLRAYIATGFPLTCLRIRLDPGDGYLAPTELLPHDGSTMGITEPSTAAFWLGHWPRRTFDLSDTRGWQAVRPF